ncbi:hypothetical protein CVT24_006861 [Panaeolus cyanescens]|uniref:FH2 domain-containing protein n=1 Tax=Panaeolus cyanescens TaxID=181874 RepID=A0A409X1K2_9AGAR|nr:hypothetical protein CVT24_006861 [Panaeolus cyanescens]
MKPFFWNKIGNVAGESSVWNDLVDDLQLDFSDLEDTFVLNEAPPTPSQISAPRKANVITLLDITRANNIGIMLMRIKMDHIEIRRALLEINDQALSLDDLKAIGKQLPTPEEIERIKSFEDVSKLAKADQYFSQIMTIPRLSARLECMQYRRKLLLEIEEVRPELNILRNASRELRSSTKFRQTLQVILLIGNTLNGSTFRGNAKGFQLDSLLKLKETKTAKGGPACPTLLHYVARTLLRKDPSLTTFIDELPNLEAAARVSASTVLQNVNSLVSGLNQVQEEVKHISALGNRSGDHFVAVMRRFISETTPSVEALKNMGDTVDKELKSLLLYYGEKQDGPEAPKPEDFFGLIASFSSSLQKCALEVHDAEAKLGSTPSTPASRPVISPAIQSSSLPVPSVLVQQAPEQEGPVEPTIKGSQDATTPTGARTPTQGSTGYAAGNRSLGRGDLDEAIRSMRTAKRRQRVPRPASKIFLDGATHSSRPASRLFD